MRILRMVLHNYGSFYGTHEVEIAGRGLTFVRGENLDEPAMESNGAGKSTLFDAIAWGLFGHVPRKDSVGSIVSEGEKQAWVILVLQDEKQLYWVYRRRATSTTVRFFEAVPGEWIERTALDGDATQNAINTALGLDKEIFHAAVYKMQGEGESFATATDAQRKAMLTRLVPELAEVDELQARAKALLKSTELQIQQCAGHHQGLSQQLGAAQGRDWEAERAAWEAARETRAMQARQAFEAAETALRTAFGVAEGLLVVQKELAALQNPVESTVWQEELAVRRQALAQARVQAQVVESQRVAAQKRMDTAGAVCGECGKPLTEADRRELKGRCAALGTQVQQQASYIHQLEQQEAEAVVAFEQERRANTAAQRQVAARRGALETQLKHARAVDLVALQTARDQVAGLEASVRAEVWPSAQHAAEAQQRAAELRTQLAAVERRRGELEYARTHAVFWTKALSNSGIKSYILDARLETMTAAANEWVSKLTAGTMWVRFESQKLTSGGKLVDQLTTRVFRHNPEGAPTMRNFRSWSGGEKSRVALAIDHGVSQLLAERAAKRWNLAIWDESFRRHMDQGGREAVFDLLQTLDRETVFLVDHDPQMAAQFEQEIVVRIQNRRSRVIGPGCSDAVSPDPHHHLPGGAHGSDAEAQGPPF